MAEALALSPPQTGPPHSRPVVGIFWDIENCNVPRGKDAGGVAEKIRAMDFCKDKAEMEFRVVCDVTKEQEEVIDDLNAAQVTVQHVAAGRKKNASDEKLRQAMRHFVDNYTKHFVCPVTLVMISGDQDFAPDLSDYRRRSRVHVVLIHNRLAPDILKKCAVEALDFHDMCLDVPERPVQAATPFQYTEILVSNLPSSYETNGAQIERKLEEQVKA